jgi:hypothetical protein
MFKPAGVVNQGLGTFWERAAALSTSQKPVDYLNCHGKDKPEKVIAL